MFNLIKMYLYQLTHAMSTWIMIFCVIALAVFSTVMTNQDLKLIQQENLSGYETMDTAEENDDTTYDYEIGIMVNSDAAWIHHIPAGDLVASQISSGLLLLLVSIFTAIFFHGEQKKRLSKKHCRSVSRKRESDFIQSCRRRHSDFIDARDIHYFCTHYWVDSMG